MITMERIKPLTFDEAFEMSMELWDILSRIDDFSDACLYVKGMILTEVLEYQQCSSDCPFCEYVSDKEESCELCPIYIDNSGGGCHRTPYEEWSNEVFYNNKHIRKEAKDFFDYLCTIYEKHYNRPYGK